MLPVILGFLGPIIKPILDKIPNPGEREKVRLEFEAQMKNQELELLKLLQASDQAQADINKVEAANPSLFVSGWRPGIAWICGIAFAWAYVLQPITIFIFTVFNHPIEGLPEFNMSEMMPVLMGILGLGGIRSFEKLKGIAGK
jgi:hypothetical protein